MQSTYMTSQRKPSHNLAVNLKKYLRTLSELDRRLAYRKVIIP